MRCRIWVPIVLPLVLVALVAACSGESLPAPSPGDQKATESEPAPTAQPTEEATDEPVIGAEEESVTPSPGAPEAGTTPGADALVAEARQDLADRLDVPAAEIRLVSVEPVEWPNAGLGCPQPGMMYAQVITPGYRLVLEAGGKVYEYHTDRGRTIVLCEEASGMRNVERDPTVEPGLEPLVERAKGDLAERLSASTEAIEVVEAQAVTWPNGALGCPQPGMAYTQVPQDGALIRLRFEGRVYRYHSGGGRGPFLCEQPPRPPKGTPSS